MEVFSTSDTSIFGIIHDNRILAECAFYCFSGVPLSALSSEQLRDFRDFLAVFRQRTVHFR